MKFIWDRSKNEANIKKHELDFADAYKVFESPMLVGLDEREEYGEDRWIGIGLMENRVVVIVFTEPDEDSVRVISFRKATTDERNKYEQEYKNQFGSF
ncbi:MAG: hypothetical protein DCC56_05105 [Anaerolineae bacterium]|nr:MAG: hypothetical protein DCC56_05105 [Anaerolineae bacterium]WKZ43767.1 MAG: BrnT family toxin [Anaerolineales bacterium]